MSYKFLSTILGINANFTGRLGVGTTTPGYPLEVTGTAPAVDSIAMFTATNSTEGLGIYNSASSNPQPSLRFFHNTSSYRIWLYGAGNLAFVNTWNGGTPLYNFFGSGNFGIGVGFTDSGYKLDVNGTTRIVGVATFNNNITQTSGSATFANGIILDSTRRIFGGNTITYQSNDAASQHYFKNDISSGLSGTLVTIGNGSGTFGTTSASNFLNISGRLATASGTNNLTSILLNHTVENTGTYTGTIRGIYYNPSSIVGTGFTHRAIETTTGDVIFNSTSGSVGIGTTSPGQKLDVNGNIQLSSNSPNIISYTSYASNIFTVKAQQTSGVDIGGMIINTGSGESRFGSFRSGGGYFTTFFVNNAELIRLSTSNNVLIGTATDSGYKLDVNGTTRLRSDAVFGLGNGLMILGRNTGGAQSQSMIQFDGANGWNFAITNFSSQAYLDLTNDGRFTMGNNIIYTSRDSSAVLNLVATDRGFLQPRMTTTQRNAIATPATGLSIYNTTTNTEDYYNGSAWVSLQTSITNPVTGTGTTNYLPKWTGSTALGNSLMYDNGTTLLVGTTTASTDYSSALLALSKSNNLTYQEIRGSSQATLVLTQGVTANSTTPAVEIFNGYNFGIKFIGGTGGAFSNYPLYYYAGDGAGTGDYVMMQAGGSERLRIASNGNVQIGTTTNAGYKLDVNGTTRIYGASTSSLMIDTVGTADMASSITFRQNSPNWSSSIGTHTSGGGLHYGLQFKSQPSTVNFVINRDGSTYFGGFGLANSSSLVELSSTTKGFLPPRMTSAQRTAISTPAVGLIVYQTDSVEGVYVYTSGGWKSLTMV